MPFENTSHPRPVFYPFVAFRCGWILTLLSIGLAAASLGMLRCLRPGEICLGSLAVFAAAIYAWWAARSYIRTGRNVASALLKRNLSGRVLEQLPIAEQKSLQVAALREGLAWSCGLLSHEEAYRILQQAHPKEAERLRFFWQFSSLKLAWLALLPGIKPGLEWWLVRAFRQNPRPLRVAAQMQSYVWGQKAGQSYIMELMHPAPAPDFCQDVKIAELWLGCHPKNPGMIRLAGMPMALDRFADAAGPVLLGRGRKSMGQLFKILDAAEPLSLQIHEKCERQGKHETWMISLDPSSQPASEDGVLAELYVGFRPLEEMDGGILRKFKAEYVSQTDDAGRLRCFQTHYSQALERGRTDPQGLEIKAYCNRFVVCRENGRIELYLNDRKQPESAKQLFGLNQDGLVVNIPGATPHVLQKGTVYELQQMTDKTLRLYDNGRNDPNRPLHIKEAMEKLDFTLRRPEDYIIPPRILDRNQTNLIRTDYYFLDKIQLTTSQSPYSVSLEGCYQILLMVQGQGQMLSSDTSQKPLLLSKGDIILVPAQLASYSLLTASQLALLKIHE